MARASWSTGSDASARAAGESAAAEALRGHGKSEARMTITWEDARLVRCQPVTAVVTYRVPLITVPWLGSFSGGGRSTSARHREIVDPYGRRLDTTGFDAAACNA